MPPIRTAAPGLLLLFAALSLTACNSGKLVTRTEIVEVARKQYVALPHALTDDMPEPPKPAAACVADGKPTLCNAQLLEWIDALRDALGIANDGRRALRELQAQIAR